MRWLSRYQIVALVGFSFLWAYIQKGFLSTRLIWVPQNDTPFATAVFLFSLFLSVAICAVFHARIESYFTKRHASMAVFAAVVIINELFAYNNGIFTLSGQAEYLLCSVYYLIHAATLIVLFFAWMLWFVQNAFRSGLSSTVSIMLAAMLISRIITMPYFYIWEFFATEETFFLEGLSLVLYIFSLNNSPQPEVRFSGHLSQSSLLKRYLAPFTIYFFSGVSSRLLQGFSDDFFTMQVFNSSREIICFAFLALCLSVLLLSHKQHRIFLPRDTFFLVAGLSMGAVVGQLLGISTGVAPMLVFFDFIEVSRAILLVVSVLLVLLIVYEESVSPVLAFGVFVLGPIIIWRTLNLLSNTIGPMPVSEWVYVLILVLVALLFLITSLMFLLVFVGSNSFKTFFQVSAPTPNERQATLDKLAKHYQLTQRESDIFEYLALGYTAKSIGEKLYISPYTAQNHIRCIYSKLGVHSKQEVINLIEAQSSTPV